jgi:hypothetical protein
VKRALRFALCVFTSRALLAMSNRNTSSFDWSFFIQWVLVTTLGWLLGQILAGLLGVGALTGAAQWLVLRLRVRQAGWWVAASIAGWFVGIVVLGVVVAGAELPPEAGTLAGVALGAAIGAAQWLILCRWVHQAGWWIVVSTLGWAAGLSGFVGPDLVGAVVGVVTGITIELLIRYPRLEV